MINNSTSQIQPTTSKNINSQLHSLLDNINTKWQINNEENENTIVNKNKK